MSCTRWISSAKVAPTEGWEEEAGEEKGTTGGGDRNGEQGCGVSRGWQNWSSNNCAWIVFVISDGNDIFQMVFAGKILQSCQCGEMWTTTTHCASAAFIGWNRNDVSSSLNWCRSVRKKCKMCRSGARNPFFLFIFLFVSVSVFFSSFTFFVAFIKCREYARWLLCLLSLVDGKCLLH